MNLKLPTLTAETATVSIPGGPTATRRSVMRGAKPDKRLFEISSPASLGGIAGRVVRGKAEDVLLAVGG